jgi:hypothetical protein
MDDAELFECCTSYMEEFFIICSGILFVKVSLSPGPRAGILSKSAPARWSAPLGALGCAEATWSEVPCCVQAYPASAWRSPGPVSALARAPLRPPCGPPLAPLPLGFLSSGTLFGLGICSASGDLGCVSADVWWGYQDPAAPPES